MSKNFDYNKDFEYWTTDGISQVEPAFDMMTLPTVYPELMIWATMFWELLSCNWMWYDLLQNTVEPKELKACLDLAITDKFGQVEE